MGKIIHRACNVGLHKIFSDCGINHNLFKEKQHYYACPVCGEAEDKNIITLRPALFECRACGYIDDDKYWSKNKNYKGY